MFCATKEVVIHEEEHCALTPLKDGNTVVFTEHKVGFWDAKKGTEIKVHEFEKVVEWVDPGFGSSVILQLADEVWARAKEFQVWTKDGLQRIIKTRRHSARLSQVAACPVTGRLYFWVESGLEVCEPGQTRTTHHGFSVAGRGKWGSGTLPDGTICSLIKVKHICAGLLQLKDPWTFKVTATIEQVISCTIMDDGSIWVSRHAPNCCKTYSLWKNGVFGLTVTNPISGFPCHEGRLFQARDGLGFIQLQNMMYILCFTQFGDILDDPELFLSIPYYNDAIVTSTGRVVTHNREGDKVRLGFHSVFWPSRMAAIHIMVLAWAKGGLRRKKHTRRTTTLEATLGLRRFCRTLPVEAGTPGSWTVVEPFARAIIAFL